MRLRNQDFNHVTTHTFTLNQSITHTLSLVWEWIKSGGGSLSIMTLYPLLMEPKTVSRQDKDQPLSIRATDHQSAMPSSNLSMFPTPVSFVFDTSDRRKWRASPAPPLPSLPTQGAVFSTPVNDKTMLPCYLTAAAEGDYSPVEAWCLSSGGRGLPAPWSDAWGFYPWSKFTGHTHLERPERFPAEGEAGRLLRKRLFRVNLGARELFSSSVHSQ